MKSHNGATKVRGKILVFRDNKAFSICKGCGAERQVPIHLDHSALKPESPRPPLFVSKSKVIK